MADESTSDERATAMEGSREWSRAFGATAVPLAVVERTSGAIVFATPAFASVHGYALDALIGSSLDRIAPASSLASALPVEIVEATHRRADGSTFPARVDRRVQGAHAILTVEDLSERRATELALRSSERLLHEAQRVARVGSWEWDVDRNTLTWSDTLCALYGIAPSDAPRTFDGYLALVHADDRDEARALAERAFADGRPFAFDHRVTQPDGTVRTLHGRGEVVTDARGRVLRMIGSSEDVTERRAAERRTVQLQALTAALVAAASESAVADVVLEQSMSAFGACGGTVVRLLDDDATICIVGHAGYGVDVANTYRRYPLASPSPTADAIRAGEPQVITGAAEIHARYPFIRGVFESLGARTLVSVPLRIAERTVGGLALFLREERRVDGDELRMVLAFAGQCAQAMERARHFEAERAGRAAERFLVAAGQALAESLDHETTLQRVADLAVPAVADWAMFYRVEADADIVRRLAIAGPREVCDGFNALEIEHPVRRDHAGVLSRVLNEGAELYAPDVTDEMLDRVAFGPAHAARLKSLGHRSVIIVPLQAHDATLGALLLGTGGSRTLGTRELDLARRLADRAALAIESSRRYEGERAARAEAEGARRRAAFLADASRLLGESLDFAETLRRVARGFVPAMADWCAVDLLDDARGVELVALAHQDPEREAWARDLRTRFPVRLDDPLGLGRVLREGTAEFMAEVDPAVLESVARSDEERAVLREIAIASYVCVPMRIAGKVIGALSFVYTSNSGRRYDASDLALAEELARRAATAIDHARAYRAAHIANQAKNEFLAVMSHELRTPLNAIGGYVELLELELRGPLTDAQRRDLERIRIAQQHLLGLISAVLDLSRIESGRVQYALDTVPVAPFLESLDALIGPQAAAKSLVLECAPCADTLGVRADREKLRQILLNLLSNAVRYTPAGGRVTMHAAGRGAQVAIVVSDTGIGIPATELQRIFEPFVQLDRTITPQREGVGLGLAISRDLARGMGGDLTVESAPGAGSAFTLWLPAAAVPNDRAWLATGQMQVVR